MTKRKYIFPSAKNQTQSATSHLDHFELATSIAIATDRDEGVRLAEEASDDQVVELVFEDDTTWIGRAGDLAEIFGDPLQDRSDDEEFVVPLGIESADQERGLFKKIALKVVNFFVPKALEAVTEVLVKKAGIAVDKKAQPNPGLYAVDANFKPSLIAGKVTESAKPYLLFLHGTGSSLQGSFGKMTSAEDQELWRHLQKNYENRILALEHYTFSKSPFDNLLDLVQQLPKKCTLHIISHSRGGLIGELLSRFHTENSEKGFNKQIRPLAERVASASTLKKIEKEMSTRIINVEKFIRVACPAQGTTIISQRLDHFLNALIGGIQLAAPQAAPILKPLKQLVAAVAAQKDDPDVLPGIAVMNPSSDFQRLINYQGQVLNAPLTVVAGNGKFGLSGKGFLNVLIKLYFWKYNDWVVDTRYMLRGTPRHKDFPYVIDNRDEVNHFSYFKNAKTQKLIVNALTVANGATPFGFSSMSYEEAQAYDRGVIMGSYMETEVSGDKPVLIIVPGILGSNLSDNGEEIYLDLDRLVAGGMKRLTMDNGRVTASSVIGDAYRDFGTRMSQEYDVYTFAFDWRKSVREEGKRLTKLVESLLTQVKDHRIVFAAHSMGGLVVREVMANKPTWKKLQEREHFRCIFFGSPLGGSYLIPEVLVGVGKRIKQMAFLDVSSSSGELLRIFSTYTGLLELLPLQDVDNFGVLAPWQRMKKLWSKKVWHMPSNEAIRNFKNYKAHVHKLGEEIYAGDEVIYVAGKADSTVDGMRKLARRRPGKQLGFTSTTRGDGSVTWDTGIPPILKREERVYYVDVKHGALLKKKHIFDGIEELFSKGVTQHNEFSKHEIKGEKRRFFGLFRDELAVPSASNLARIMLDSEDEDEFIEERHTQHLEVSIAAGHLEYANHPVVIGHLLNDAITHAESALDYTLNGILRKSHALGNYPQQIGDNQLFHVDGKSRALIVGLGKLEQLSAIRLEQTIVQGMLKYLFEHSHISVNETKSIGLSMLFIGSGYVGLTLESSIKATLNAAQKANSIAQKSGIENVYLGEIEFVELYIDKSMEARHILDKLLAAGDYNFSLTHNQIIRQPGRRERIVTAHQTSWWKRITIESIDTEKDETPTTKLRFISSSGKARTEEYHLELSNGIINALVNYVSVDKQWDEESAKVLFELLIPAEYKEEWKLKQNMLLLVDARTAAYPWEMLQDNLSDAEPICTEIGLIRQLTTPSSAQEVNYPMEDKALVVGDPDTGDMLPPLPGAASEAHMASTVLDQHNFDVKTIVNSGHLKIVGALYTGQYKVVHLAGHGVYDPAHPAESGMVIGKDTYLTPSMIQQLPYTPELVFVNCCHLGSVGNIDDVYKQHRGELAANFGVELIKGGVKAIIVAGWAVNDAAAKLFAATFYREMFNGQSFGDAVKEARKDCFRHFPHTNTWGAYQCYGDYSYKLRMSSKKTATGGSAKKYVFDEEIFVDLRNEMARADAKYQQQDQRDRIFAIEQGVEAHTHQTLEMYEQLANTYFEYRLDEDALRCFTKMFSFHAANYSIRSIEKYHLLNRKIVLKTAIQENAVDLLRAKDIKVLNRGISVMKNLQRTHETAERHHLIGGNYKVLSLVTAIMPSKKKAQLVKALKSSIDAYAEGLALEKEVGRPPFFPLCNIIALETVLLDLATQQQKASISTRIHFYHSMMEDLPIPTSASSSDYNHWNLMAKTNKAFCTLLVEPSEQNYLQLEKQAQFVKDNGGSMKKWSSELEQISTLLRLYSANNERAPYLNRYRTLIQP